MPVIISGSESWPSVKLHLEPGNTTVFGCLGTHRRVTLEWVRKQQAKTSASKKRC